MYILQGKTWQHDICTISRILRTIIVHNDNQGAGPGPPLASACLARDTSPVYSCRSSARLEARLGNLSLTRFQVKQATRSRCVFCAVFILPSVLWCNRQTIPHLVLRPKIRNYHGDFVGQSTKLQLSVLRLKSGNPSEWFWGQTTRTVATSFEAKPGETVDLGFEAKPRNPLSSSLCVWCRLHTASSDLSIVWPSSIRPLLDHPRSSAPSILLLPWSSSLPAMSHLSPTHHEASKYVSPHETNSRVELPKFPGVKFKTRQEKRQTK
jgi:hypothetical protein